ncbi:glucosamine-6-phosphate deaminase [Agrococcus sp. ProA11]|uniref:glucosamine-6-phosphate deaminase n=1 Tax=Agrococcus chionoecetis TaxID=3153752 RepID=UPI00325FF638
MMGGSSVLHLAEDRASAGRLVADRVAAALHARKDAVLGVATGSTPEPVWAALAERALDLARVRAFALDEYFDIAEDHPERYRAVVEREIVRPLGLDPALVRTPGDDGRDAGAPERFEHALAAAGGIDMQVLGIGSNGHIAFNEPGSAFDSRTRIARLTEETRRDNARFFSSLDDVPRRCITQGIGTILEARSIVLLAFGPHKAPAIAAALEGPVTTAMPASALQLHPRVTVVVDRAAAAGLRHPERLRSAGELV